MMEEDKFARAGDMPPPITVRVSDTAWTIHYPVFVLDGDEGHWEYPTLNEEEDEYEALNSDFASWVRDPG